MIVVIPHPEAEALIKKSQKELCEILNNASNQNEKNNNQYFFPQFPLWFPLKNDVLEYDASKISLQKEKLKSFADKISEIKIKSELKENNLYLKMKIRLKDCVYDTSLPFFLSDKKIPNEKIAEVSNFLRAKNKIPEEINIFRLGKEIKLTEHSQALEYFVWKKIKKD